MNQDDVALTFNTSKFVSLPDEILLVIFCHLDLKSLLQVSTVCRKFRRLIHDEIFVDLNNIIFEAYVARGVSPPIWLCEIVHDINIPKPMVETPKLLENFDPCERCCARHILCRINSNAQVSWMCKFLSRMKSIQSLDISHSPLNDNHLDFFKEMTALTDLSMVACKEVTTKGLCKLEPLKNLVTVDLSGCNQLDDFTPLHKLPNLKVIRFRSLKTVKRGYFNH